MKIRILGSGGGEAYPAAFCSCEHCEQARRQGGKSIRTRSQTMINDDLLVDFPADTSIHCATYGINLGKLQHVLITHSHSDHYVPILADMRCAPYAHNLKYEHFYFCGPENLEAVYRHIMEAYSDASDKKVVDFITLPYLQEETIGRYQVTALRANHAPGLGARNYIIEEGETALLYLLDTGYPTEETLDYLQNCKKVFRGVIMDSNMGRDSWTYHMGFEDDKRLKAELLERGAADENTKFVITHITHNGCETHDKIEAIFEGTGIIVAYDGIEFEI